MNSYVLCLAAEGGGLGIFFFLLEKEDWMVLICI